MKPHISTILLLAALLSLAACSSDDDPAFTDDAVRNAYLAKLTGGKITASFQMDDYAYMIKTQDSEEWKSVNLDEYDGWQVPVPARIVFHKGELLTPLSLFNVSTGPHILYYPFEAYRIATGFYGNIFVSHPLEYDNEAETMTIYGGRYAVNAVSDRSIVIETLSRLEYVHGSSDTKWVLSYSSSDFLQAPIVEFNVYPSEGEACLGVIGMLRAEFGDSFDMNPYLMRKGMRVADSVVELDELEAAVRAKYGL